MSKQSSGFLSQFLLPVVAVVASVAGIVCALLIWSTSEIDTIAEGRQRQIVETVLTQSIQRIAHDQEASTYWDDAVREVSAAKPDLDWLDNNLGIWLHSYYGHDATYIVDGANQPIYAMRDGRRETPDSYRHLRLQMLPLIIELRDKMRRGAREGIGPTVLTPGASDLAILDGRPAIISAKPIIPETQRVAQIPGREHIHISVRYLDGSFLRDLSGQYWVDEARFSWTARYAPGESAEALRTRKGQVIGYVLWTPFAPGSQVMGKLAPALAAALLAVALIVTLLLIRIRRTLAALKASEAQAQHLAFHDTLTGLANRALFQDRLDHALASVRRGAPSVALFYLDLDRFKAVNDTLGHPAGDQLIRDVAHRLKLATRDTDTVARLGGDEFAIIQSGGATPAMAEVLCLRLVEAIAEPFDLDGTRVAVGVSIGVAIAPAHGTDRIELSRKADIALYEAKAHGRGRYVLFTEAMDATVKRRQSIEHDLREALEVGGQLELHYQPIHEARTRAVIGVEALIRWRHPVQGLMAPSTFIPIAEESDLIEPIGEWALYEACRAARRWQFHSVAVNVSAVQLRNPAFPETVLGAIRASGIDPHRLELEITETSFIENESACERNIVALREQGVRIALDDFGTGYSSLNHLRDFEVDRLKVDRSFVAGIDHREGGSAIIRAIVGLAVARGIMVTAEGVETAEQAAWLTSVGCDALQGYLLSRPQPQAQIDAQFGATVPTTAG